MKVLFVHPGLCARAWKEAYALHSMEVEVHLATQSTQPTIYDLTVFKSITRLPREPRGIRRVMTKEWPLLSKSKAALLTASTITRWFMLYAPGRELHRIAGKVKPDIIHCHNSPDTLTVAAICAGFKNVIHDTHDTVTLYNLRYCIGGNSVFNLYADFERIANQRSAGLIFVSDVAMRYAMDKYGVPSKKCHVLPNYFVGAHLKTFQGEKLSAMDDRIHAVYEGCVGGRIEGDELDLFRELARSGIVVHAYLTSWDERYLTPYRELAGTNSNFRLHDPVPPGDLIQALSAYDCGICPFLQPTVPTALADTALPNKLFEYLAARLPVVAYGSEVVSKFLSFIKAGTTFKAISDAPDAVRKATKIKLNIELSKYSIEHNIIHLIKFYEKILSGGTVK